jgi:hypothetical protein
VNAANAARDKKMAADAANAEEDKEDAANAVGDKEDAANAEETEAGIEDAKLAKPGKLAKHLTYLVLLVAASYLCF